MKQVFADTSFYVATVSAKDDRHELALDLSQRTHGTVVTTHYVLLELGNWLRQTGDRDVFVSLLENVRADDLTIVVPASEELFERGVELYRQREDKEWSLTDCISFVVMHDHGISEALTADSHFEQAGFVAQLR